MKYDWSKERIEKAIKESDSYADTLRYLQIPNHGRNIDTLKSKITLYKLSIDHFTFSKQYYSGTENFKYKPVEYYLHEHSNIKTTALKDKLFKEGYKTNSCENPNCPCKSGYWLDNIISCQLHHINGDRTDNRLENLQILCPNCHSQTDNFAGKSSHRVFNKETRQMEEKKHYYCPDCGKEIWKNSKYCSACAIKHRESKIKQLNITKQDLIQDYINCNYTMTELAKKYSVTDTAIRKWCRKLGIPSSKQDLKEYIQLGEWKN